MFAQFVIVCFMNLKNAKMDANRVSFVLIVSTAVYQLKLNALSVNRLDLDKYLRSGEILF
jgi:hypothetical protein